MQVTYAGGEQVVYDLFAWTDHHGSNDSSGHYTAHSRHFNGSFYKCVCLSLTRPLSRCLALSLARWPSLSLSLSFSLSLAPSLE